MSSVFWVALGGALGAVARYGVIAWLPFPFGTLAVNVVGSFAIGVCFVLLPDSWRALVVVGGLGALTTFSTFSLDSLRLVEQGQLAQAGLYILASVTLSLAAVWLGVRIAS